jgi:DMSO/TMAO reductase YedYZ molybdopterin-dependent catalytic subunit
MTLPPGQRAINGFPRFGAHFNRPAPSIPSDPTIAVGGAVTEPFAVPLAELASISRTEFTTDFHCVAGWSATDLRWEGVAFETFYRTLVEPKVLPGTPITHVVFGGLDGYRSVVTIEDALTEDVLIAEHLDGRPLDGDHGAPVRLVSPRQYGYISTKHLCLIDLHTSEPDERYHPSTVVDRGLRLVKPHERARVWEEERHRHLPGWAVRRVYRLLIPPIRFVSARGSQGGASRP